MSEKTAAYWYQRIAEDVAELGFVDPSRYEVRQTDGCWRTTTARSLLVFAEWFPEHVRHKPRRITISGPGGEYSYPEPLREAPSVGTRYWAPDKRVREHASYYEWANTPGDYLRLQKGLCHLERESAVKHAKAEVFAAGFTL